MFYGKIQGLLKDRYQRVNAVLLTAMAVLSAVLLGWEFGMVNPDEIMPGKFIPILRRLNYLVLGLFFFQAFVGLLFSEVKFAHIRRHIARYALFAALVLVFVFNKFSIPGDSYFLLLKLFMLAVGIGMLFNTFIRLVRFNAPFSLIISFIVIISIGTLLLMLPRATVHHGSAPFLDALFTSASATCVTGLAVHNTAEYFSPFGQTVILVLIQIGGLGLMTFVAFFTMTVGRGMFIREQAMMQDILDAPALGGVNKVLAFILSFTIIAELAGAVLMYFSTPWALLETANRLEYTFFDRVFVSVFHSVSAFCNAGFSVWPSNFAYAAHNYMFNIAACLLIIIGGLGFTVNLDLLEIPANWMRRLFGMKKPSGQPWRLELHSKLVLIMTAVLIVSGMLVTYVLEYNSDNFKPLSEGEKVMASGFHSVSSRTAGFNTVDTAKMSEPTQFFTIMLMYIGASPGGTGGGIKTSTFFLCILTMVALFRRRKNVEAFRRQITNRAVNSTLVIVALSIALVALSTFVLAITEGGRFTLMKELFEVTSAFGTVGLSLGVTPELSEAGKIVITLVMFLGRIGPFTIVLALAYKASRMDYEYPTGKVMIG
jgi:trk system potassium uptake protein TrkH